MLRPVPPQNLQVQDLKKSLSVVVHICDLSTWELETGRSELHGHLQLLSESEVSLLLQACHPRDLEAEARR